MSDDDARTPEAEAAYFTQPIDATTFVRHEPSDAEIDARLEAGETLESIAAEIAAARVVSDQ